MQYTYESDHLGSGVVRSLDEWKFWCMWTDGGDRFISPEPSEIVELRARLAAFGADTTTKGRRLTSDERRLEQYEQARKEFEALAVGLQKANGAGQYVNPNATSK
jgi:hypothetical protein